MSVMRIAMKLSGSLESGGGGRVLRSHSTKSKPSAKFVNSKISFKSKKVVKGAAEKSKVNESPSREGNRSANRQADPSILVSGNQVDTALEIGKKAPDIRRKRALTSVVVDIEEKAAAVGAGLAGLGSDDGAVLEKVTLSSVKTSWSSSLSTADAIAVATKHLTAADAKLGSLIGRHGQGPKFEQCVSCFTALARSIVYQQLATKAASAIYGRLVALCGGTERVTPTIVAGLTEPQLREVGISGRKASYLHDLSQHFLSGSLSDKKLMVMEEDELVTALTSVKGIGVWSAHMFMIFWLHKPDVLPVGDLGIRKGFQKLYQLKAVPSPAQMEELASSWRPYRSLGAWYLWRVGELTVPLS